jgi:hypothetical protein
MMKASSGKSDPMNDTIYLGDAVYAHYHGYGIELKLNDHRNECAVYLAFFDSRSFRYSQDKVTFCGTAKTRVGYRSAYVANGLSEGATAVESYSENRGWPQ